VPDVVRDIHAIHAHTRRTRRRNLFTRHSIDRLGSSRSRYLKTIKRRAFSSTLKSDDGINALQHGEDLTAPYSKYFHNIIPTFTTPIYGALWSWEARNLASQPNCTQFAICGLQESLVHHLLQAVRVTASQNTNTWLELSSLEHALTADSTEVQPSCSRQSTGDLV